MISPVRVSSRPKVAEQEVHRHQHADGGHHLGGQHPQQRALGALRRKEGHGVGGGDGDQRAPASVAPTEITTLLSAK